MLGVESPRVRMSLPCLQQQQQQQPHQHMRVASAMLWRDPTTALTVAVHLLLQLKVFTAWTNADSAAVSFIVQVFKGTATAPPAAVDANTTTVLVRSRPCRPFLGALDAS